MAQEIVQKAVQGQPARSVEDEAARLLQATWEPAQSVEAAVGKKGRARHDPLLALLVEARPCKRKPLPRRLDCAKKWRSGNPLPASASAAANERSIQPCLIKQSERRTGPSCRCSTRTSWLPWRNTMRSKQNHPKRSLQAGH